MKLPARRLRRGHLIIEAAIAVALLTAAAAFQFRSFSSSVAQTAHAMNVAAAQAWLDNFSALISSGNVTRTGGITLSPTLAQGITFSTSQRTFSNISIGAGRNAERRFNATIGTRIYDRGTTGNTRLFEYYVTLTASRTLVGGTTKTYTFSRSILRQVQL